MGRPSCQSFDWRIDFRVEIMAAFLAFCKFKFMKEENTCVYSELYGNDIAEYWNERRELTRISTFDKDSLHDPLFSAEIRKAVKEIIRNDYIAFERGCLNMYKLKFNTNNQDMWESALKTSLNIEGEFDSMEAFFQLRKQISEYFTEQNRKIEKRKASDLRKSFSERMRSSKSKSVSSSSGSSKSKSVSSLSGSSKSTPDLISMMIMMSMNLMMKAH
jgi:hypothetical protein